MGEKLHCDTIDVIHADNNAAGRMFRRLHLGSAHHLPELGTMEAEHLEVAHKIGPPGWGHHGPCKAALPVQPAPWTPAPRQSWRSPVTAWLWLRGPPGFGGGGGGGPPPPGPMGLPFLGGGMMAQQVLPPVGGFPQALIRDHKVEESGYEHDRDYYIYNYWSQ